MPKVIGVDSYDRDYNGGCDEIVAGDNLSASEAAGLASELNKRGGGTWYVVKPDDYKPYKFEGY